MNYQGDIDNSVTPEEIEDGLINALKFIEGGPAIRLERELRSMLARLQAFGMKCVECNEVVAVPLVIDGATDGFCCPKCVDRVLGYEPTNTIEYVRKN